MVEQINGSSSGPESAATVDVLKNLQLPEIFSRKKLFGFAGNLLGLELADFEKTLIRRVIGILKSQEVSDLVERGHLTYAMIRPNVNDSKIGLEDEEAADFLLQKATEDSGLEVAFKFPIVLDGDFIEELYQGEPKVNQKKVSPIREEHKIKTKEKDGQTVPWTRWEEWKYLMTNGPTTIVLFYADNPEDDAGAVELWRHKLGKHWDASKCLPGTLRAEYAKADNYNNLGHGSDSKESVKREIGLIAKYLESVLK